MNCYICNNDCDFASFSCECCNHKFCLDCMLNTLHFYQDLEQDERDIIDNYGKLKNYDHWCPCYFREAKSEGLVSECLNAKQMKDIILGISRY